MCDDAFNGKSTLFVSTSSAGKSDLENPDKFVLTQRRSTMLERHNRKVVEPSITAIESPSNVAVLVEAGGNSPRQPVASATR